MPDEKKKRGFADLGKDLDTSGASTDTQAQGGA